MKKFLYAATAATLCSSAVFAQKNLGIATSDWSGMNGLTLNPASIANSREKLVVEIFSTNVGLENNLGKISTTGGLFGALSKDQISANDVFSYSSRNTFSLMAPYVEMRGPGIMYNINRRHSVALSTGIRGFNQFNNFDQSLFRTIADPYYTYQTNANGNLDLTSKNFNYTAHLWSQVGISYAALLVDEGEHKIRAGITARYLGGIAYVGLKGNNLDAHYRAGYDSLFVTQSDIEFASNVLSNRNAVLNGFSSGSLLSKFFGGADGSGWGADLGVIYDYMPYPDAHVKHVDGDSRYRLRVSASVTDLGHINYSSNVNFNANVSGNGYVTGKGLNDNVHDFETFRTYAKKQGFKADTLARNTKVYMPTALVLGADYNVIKDIYVNATFIGNIANRNNFGNSYYGTVTLTPRYDRKLFSLALPVSYSMLSQSMKVGVGARIMGFYVGSTDMLALFAKNQYGFNMYVGGYVPLYKRGGVRHYSYRGPLDDSTGYDMDADRRDHDTVDDCPDRTLRSFDAPVREHSDAHVVDAEVRRLEFIANERYTEAVLNDERRK